MPRFSLRSVWNHWQYATLFTWSGSFNSWTTEIRYTCSFAFFAARWQVLWTTLIPAKVSKVTSWETPVVGPSHFGSFPLTLLDDLPYARPIKSPWFPVSSTRPKCWTCSADVGLQTSPGISIDVTYRFCFPISANNKHSLLQSIPIHFPTILCELIHTLTLTNNNRIV